MSKAKVAEFWKAMGTNDFVHASQWLSPEFEHFMPQTGEYLRGREAFAALNAAYPASGLWVFDVRSLIGEGDEVVSDVAVTDGALRARAITFHTVHDGLIRRQVEYWPDGYDAPEWRSRWVRVITDWPF